MSPCGNDIERHGVSGIGGEWRFPLKSTLFRAKQVKRSRHRYWFVYSGSATRRSNKATCRVLTRTGSVIRPQFVNRGPKPERRFGAYISHHSDRSGQRSADQGAPPNQTVWVLPARHACRRGDAARPPRPRDPAFPRAIWPRRKPVDAEGFRRASGAMPPRPQR